MPEDEIFLIIKTISPGKCLRFAPPPLEIPVLYNRGMQAIVMLGPIKGEINFGIGPNKTVQLMEDIIQDPAGHNCIARLLSDPDAASIFKQIIANCQRLPEEPSLAPAIKGLIREQFDHIAGKLFCTNI